MCKEKVFGQLEMLGFCCSCYCYLCFVFLYWGLNPGPWAMPHSLLFYFTMRQVLHRLAFNTWPPYPSLLCAGITRVCHHTHLTWLHCDFCRLGVRIWLNGRVLCSVLKCGFDPQHLKKKYFPYKLSEFLLCVKEYSLYSALPNLRPAVFGGQPIQFSMESYPMVRVPLLSEVSEARRGYG